MAAALLAGIALDVSGPQIVRQFIDRAMAGVPVDGLVGLAGLYIVIVVSRQATAVGATWLGENVGWSATNALRADLALHCLTADLSFHNARTPGELVERIDGDVTALAAFFSQLTIGRQPAALAGGAGCIVCRGPEAGIRADGVAGQPCGC
jgi:ABC-type multidrug transport system fused ATPase/permease subunit